MARAAQTHYFARFWLTRCAVLPKVPLCADWGRWLEGKAGLLVVEGRSADVLLEAGHVVSVRVPRTGMRTLAQFDSCCHSRNELQHR